MKGGVALNGVEYRGCRIRHNLAGHWWVEDAEGNLIAADTRSEEQSRREIDSFLTGEYTQESSK